MLLDTPICDFGAAAPRFDLPDFDGNRTTLQAAMGANGLVVVFMCNHCPYVKAIIDRLVMDAKTLRGEGVNMVAIMPNNYHAYADDNPDQMRIFAQTHAMTFPYLVDETQQVAKAYGAVCTPDFFGYNRDFALQYRGRLDDARMQDASNRKAELIDAMCMVAQTGSGPQDQIPSMGCSIKWKA
ncbi:MAG: thioredoxin family protein [Pseudomonadota bacterium]